MVEEGQPAPLHSQVALLARAALTLPKLSAYSLYSEVISCTEDSS